MSWEYKSTNPENDMFRLDELYDERDEEKKVKYADYEIEIINMLLKESGSL